MQLIVVSDKDKKNIKNYINLPSQNELNRLFNYPNYVNPQKFSSFTSP